MTSILRVAALAVVGIAAGVGTGWPQSSASRTTVLAELFTSEGCSSCPPADALLRRLLSDQPVAGVEIVALGHHVDYWDRLGWRDPFSSPVSSQRQSVYGERVFGSDRIYTPQLVIDGQLEVVGSDEAAIRRAVIKAANAAHGTVDVAVTPGADGSARIELRAALPESLPRKGPADIMLAIIEDGLSTRVQRGENGGRTLAHSAVVRMLKPLAQVGVHDRNGSGIATVALAKEWNREHLRIVGFVQETASRRVLGAGSRALTASQP